MLLPKIKINHIRMNFAFLDVIIVIAYLGGITKNKKIQYRDYCHIGIQTGRVTKTLGERKIQFIYGGGLGLSFDGKDVAPRATIFSGMIIFAKADFSYKQGKGLNTDIGIQGVLPIPLKKIDFGSPGE